MAIQPIDLQTLFAQMEKVGKTQAMQKDGVQIQQALQQEQSQMKALEHVRSVNEAQEIGEETGKIKDGRGGQQYQGQEGREDTEAEGEDKKNESGLLRDPSLGSNIDISG
jgi:hypothetical protein